MKGFVVDDGGAFRNYGCLFDRVEVAEAVVATGGAEGVTCESGHVSDEFRR